MFLYTKDLLEKLESYPEFYLSLITFEGNTKKYTIYYIDTLTNDNNNIIINLVSEPKKFIVKENLNYLLYLVLKENPDSIIKLKFPNGEIIKDYNFWNLKELEENNLALIISLIPNLEKMFKILLNPFIDYGIAINYINVKVNLSQLSYRTNLLYDLIKEYLSTNFRFISNNPDYNCEDWEEDIIINFEFMPQSEKIVGVFLDKINDDPRIIADEDEAANWIFLEALNINDLYDYIHSGYELNELYKDFLTILKEFPIRSYYQSEMFQGTYLEKADIIPSILKDFKQHYKLHNELLNPIEFEEKLLDNLIYVIRNYFTNKRNFVEDYLNILIKIFESRK